MLATDHGNSAMLYQFFSYLKVFRRPVFPQTTKIPDETWLALCLFLRDKHFAFLTKGVSTTPSPWREVIHGPRRKTSRKPTGCSCDIYPWRLPLVSAPSAGRSVKTGWVLSCPLEMRVLLTERTKDAENLKCMKSQQKWPSIKWAGHLRGRGEDQFNKFQGIH